MYMRMCVYVVCVCSDACIPVETLGLFFLPLGKRIASVLSRNAKALDALSPFLPLTVYIDVHILSVMFASVCSVRSFTCTCDGNVQCRDNHCASTSAREKYCVYDRHICE